MAWFASRQQEWNATCKMEQDQGNTADAAELEEQYRQWTLAQVVNQPSFSETSRLRVRSSSA
jgi:hypothetical protein